MNDHDFHIEAATRGLGLRDKSDDDLDRLRAAHAKIDAFASGVIVEAVDAEIERRVDAARDEEIIKEDRRIYGD